MKRLILVRPAKSSWFDPTLQGLKPGGVQLGSQMLDQVRFILHDENRSGMLPYRSWEFAGGELIL